MRRLVWIGLVLAFIMPPLPVEATPPASATLPELVDASDLIIVGRFVPLEGTVNSDTPGVVFTIAVDRVLKGALPSGPKTITALARAGLGAWPIQKYGIFFLRREQGGQYSEAVPGLSSVFALPNTAAPTPGTDPYLAVTLEQVAVLATPVSALEQAPAVPYFIPNPTPIRKAELLYDDASFKVQGVPVVMARTLLEAVLKSDSDALSRCWIMTTLISVGVPVDLQSIMPFLRDPSSETEMTRAALARSLRGANIPAEMTPSLIELLGLPDVVMRRGAANALRDIKTDASTKALALIALQDNDLEVRTDAEQGLCWAMKLHSSPCDVPAEQNEEAQHRYWTNWTTSTYR